MARIKDDLLGQQDTKMEYYSKFMDSMYEVLNSEPKLSESDIEKLEEEQNSTQATSSQPLWFSSISSISTSTSNKINKDAA